MSDYEKVLKAIQMLIHERREQHRFPLIILFRELQNYIAGSLPDEELRNILNQMYRDKIIRSGKTINDKYIELIMPDTY